MINQARLKELERLVPSKFAAIVFDIDGTLTYNLKNCPAVLESMIRLVSLNLVQVVLITGRRNKTAAIFYDEIVKSPLVPRNALKKLDIYVSNGCMGFNAYSGVSNPYYLIQFDELVIAQIWKYLAQDEFQNRPEFFLELVEDRNKFIIRDLQVAPQSFFWALQKKVSHDLKRLGLKVEVKYSGNAIDITPEGYHKGFALDHLMKRLQLTDEQIIKVGDKGGQGGNDFELLCGRHSFSVDQSDPDNPNQVNVSKLLDEKCPDVTKYLIDIFVKKLS